MRRVRQTPGQKSFGEKDMAELVRHHWMRFRNPRQQGEPERDGARGRNRAGQERIPAPAPQGRAALRGACGPAKLFPPYPDRQQRQTEQQYFEAQIVDADGDQANRRRNQQEDAAAYATGRRHWRAPAGRLLIMKKHHERATI
jgi:hypothetical protein